MDKEVDILLKDAESSVLCETKEVTPAETMEVTSAETMEVTSAETMEKIKRQVLGLSRESDESFIYGLVKNIDKNKESDGGRRK